MDDLVDEDGFGFAGRPAAFLVEGQHLAGAPRGRDLVEELRPERVGVYRPEGGDDGHLQDAVQPARPESHELLLCQAAAGSAAVRVVVSVRRRL
ncbi:hypothetical protein, partial [Amycolatopsis sp. CA-126428]|uniref:hypothetical protein n=1 Tax=Amycolatopsis sp. CA-126428 TaxID=2073158 RepID=UPI001E58E1D3